MAHAKRVGPAIGAGLALIMSLVACGGDEADNSPSGDTGAGTKGGTLTVYAEEDVEHLDPARNFVTNSNMIGKLVGRTLNEFRWDAKSKKVVLEPDLAKDLGKPSDDLKTWTFTLKDGLKYEDGSPITTKDIKYNVERSFSPDLSEGSPYPKEYLACPTYKGPFSPPGNNGGKGCEAITTPDDKTIEFKLTRPVADFDATVSMKNWTPVPQSKDTKTQYDNKVFSSGPYKVETYVRKKTLVLVRNEHWDPKTDPIRTALPDKFVFQFGADPATTDQRLIANGTNDQSAISFSGLQPQNLAKTNSASVKDRLVEYADYCRRYIAFNQQKNPLLKNQKMREALFVGLDKKSYQLARGGERLSLVVDSIVPEDLDGYQPESTFKAPPEGDTAKAKQLLQEAGYAGQKLVLGTSDAGLAVKAAEAAQASWRKAGLNIEIQKIPGDNYYSTQQQDSSATDLITAGWCFDWPTVNSVVAPTLGPDSTSPGKAAQNNYARNPAGWDKMQELFKEKDKAKLSQGWGDLYTEIMKTAPLVPTVKDNNIFVVGGNVANATLDPNTGGLPDLVQIGLKKAN